MTPEQITEGRRLLDEALPGPWNLELTMWMRDNLPALLDRVEELEADLERAHLARAEAQNRASKWKQRALEAESSLAERDDSYDHLARNYRQLRADINRMIASHKMAAEYSDNEALRRAYRRIAGELTHALERPLEGDKP